MGYNNFGKAYVNNFFLNKVRRGEYRPIIFPVTTSRGA